VFPDSRTPSLKQPAIVGAGLKGFSFDPLERQIVVGIDRVDLFDKMAFDAYDIAFPKACKFLPE